MVLGAWGVLPSGCKGEGSTQAPAGSNAAIPATVAPPAVFAPEVGSSNVREECDLQNSLPMFLSEYAPSVTPGTPGSGRMLQMEIIGVLGHGGGIYSGPKQISVQGTLSDSGQVLGTFTAQRTTTGGAFGGYKGTCSLLGRTAKAVARDVSEWLVSPTMDARLGEL